jgi:hypothetical protein
MNNLKDEYIKKLFELHNKLTGALLNLVDKKETKYVESYLHPHNYLENVIKLKNTYFSGFNNNELKGCCKFEPLARFQNLLSTFPLTKYCSTKTMNAINTLWDKKYKSITNLSIDKFIDEFEELINDTISLL